MSLFTFENFWTELGDDIYDLPVLPYHEALFLHYSYITDHDSDKALYDIAAAVVHQARFAVDVKTPIRTWRFNAIADLVNLLEHDTFVRCAARIPESSRGRLLQAVEDVKLSAGARDSLLPAYAKLFHLLDEILPSAFDLTQARMLTGRLCVPKLHRFADSVQWRRCAPSEVREIGEVLQAIPDLYDRIGPQWQTYEWDDESDPGSPPTDWYTFYKLAVFDYERWHPFRLDARTMIADWHDQNSLIFRCDLWLADDVLVESDWHDRRPRILAGILREFSLVAQQTGGDMV